MALPWCFGLLALLIVVIAVIIIACIIICRKVCLRCCIRANSKGTNAAAVVGAGIVNVDAAPPRQGDPDEDGQGGPPPIPVEIPKWRRLWKKFALYFSCCETEEERDARERIGSLLDYFQNSKEHGDVGEDPL